MADLFDTIAGIYGPLLGLLAFAILWPLRLLGLGIYYFGWGIVWCAEKAENYFESWVIR